MNKATALMALLLPLMSVVPAWAAGGKDLVTQIRQMYKNTMELLDRKDQAAANEIGKFQLSGALNLPGSGLSNQNNYFFTKLKYDENGDYRMQPIFITSMFTIGARDFYQEYMFDEEGNFVFFFEKSPDGEARFYYNEEGLQHKIINGSPDVDSEKAVKMATDLVEGFGRIANREY